MGRKSAVLGFKAHTGWLTYVAVGGTPARPEILSRGRPALLPDAGSIDRFVYHEASQNSDARAREIVDRAAKATHSCATAAIAAIVEELELQGVSITACALVSASAELKAGITLDQILRTHTLIHAAEGKLYRDAIVAACFDRGLDVIAVPERDAWNRAAKACGFSEDALQKRVAALRSVVGAPWGADEKVVTAAALVAATRSGKEPASR